MTNSPNNQLDEFIKNSMKDREVPFNEAHWNEFETKLNTRPRGNTFRKWNFSMNMFLGFILFGSASVFAYVVYNSMSNNEMKSPTVDTKKDPAASGSTNNIVKNTDVKSNTDKSAEQPVVTNTMSDKNTFSIFTSEDISGTTLESNTTNTPVKNTSYSGISNSNGVLQNNAGPTVNNTSAPDVMMNGGNTNKTSENGEKIDPVLLQQVLKNAKGQQDSNTPVFFPDMIDPKKGPVNKTKESDTIKDKAEKNFNDFFPFYKTDENGNKSPNADNIKDFFKKTETGPSDSLKVSNDK